jgi:hypothetical protein
VGPFDMSLLHPKQQRQIYELVLTSSGKLGVGFKGEKLLYVLSHFAKNKILRKCFAKITTESFKKMNFWVNLLNKKCHF